MAPFTTSALPPGMNSRALSLVAALLLASGCVAPETPDAVAGGPEPCPSTLRPRPTSFTLASHWIATPDGSWTGGGKALHIPWGGDPTTLVHLDVLLEWDTQPGNERLQFGLRNPNATSADQHFAHGPYEGTSPLRAAIAAPRIDLLGAPLLIEVYIGGGSTPVGGKTLVDQGATLVVQETYDPCRSVAIGGTWAPATVK